MKIRTRLVLLLGCLVGAFGLSVATLQYSHRHEVRSILASLEKERSGLLDHLLALTGQSLESFASDYSLWDEMVGFVQSGDTAWAAINIDPSLPNFNAQAAWVVRADGALLYAANTGGAAATVALPLADPAFLKKLQAENTLHFFLNTSAGLLEVRTGPVQPSDDIKREQAARGWFLVGRLWDEKYLRTLARALQCEVTLGPSHPGAENTPVIRLQRELHDWRGEPVNHLRVDYQSEPMAELLRGNRTEAVLMYAFGAVIISVIVLGLSHWVMRPLQLLGHSLATGRSEPLAGLQRSADEFGHLARQVAQSFVQQAALRDREDQLHQAIELRGRLARDLHDGIIQSIYAAGLSLESVRNLQAVDPAAADQRLATCQKMLNDTLWQVRNFIEALEPEVEHARNLASSLTTLATTMGSVQPIAITAAADEELSRRIGPLQEMHLLQMVREAVSNALRHSGATQVRISLQADGDGGALLEISDNGHGFDPALRTGTGRGLVNLASRAREIGGTLHIDSAPGKGARIMVRFSPKP